MSVRIPKPFLSVAVLAWAAVGCGRAPQTARSLAELARLPEDVPVLADVAGVITFHNPGARLTYIQQGADAAFIEFPADAPEIPPSSRMAVTGVARRYVDRVSISASRWTVFPSSEPPAAIDAAGLASSPLEQRMVSLRGRLTSALNDRYGMLTLSLDTDRGIVNAHVRDYTGFEYEKFIGSSLRVAGVFHATADADGATIRTDLWVQSFRTQIHGIAVRPSAALASAGSGELLTRVRDIKSLSIREAATGLPVRLRATVTYSDPTSYVLFVQDGTDGVFVSCHGGPPASVRAGDRVLLTGVTGPGDFAPIVRARAFRLLGTGKMPRAVVPMLERFAAGAYDGELVTLSGIARSVYEESGHPVFRLRIPGGTASVHALGTTMDSAAKKLDARLRVTGVAGTIFNSRRQLLGTQVFVPSPSGVVTEEPPADPPPLTAISRFLQFSPDMRVGHRIRVRGTATAWDPASNTLFLQEGDTGLQVSVPALEGLTPGDTAEAVGYPSSASSSPRLLDATVRRIDQVVPVSVEKTAAAEVLEDFPEDRVVQVEGIVVDARTGGQIFEATLYSGSVRFQAQTPLLIAGKLRRAPSLSIGDRVRATGVCVSGKDRRTGAFRLIAASPDALRVIRHAPFLSGRRALYALGAAVIAAFFAGLWAFGLRRTVQRQTAVIREQLSAQEALRIQAESASRAKTQFLANMSHEIRTPMNGVLGFAALAMETTDDRRRREYLETVRESGELLVAVVNDILDFSKVESGRMTLESIPFDLHDVLANTVQSFEARAAAKGLDLDCAIENKVPRHVEGDPVRLRQIVGNLLSNALKFTTEGRVECRTSATLQDGVANIQIAVSDTGIGIPNDKQDQIFEAFTQADSSTTRQFGGTGLGLAISSRLATVAGGGLSVQSEPGAGSTFTLTLPLRVCEQATRETRRAGEDDAWVAGLTVLVAEDNTVNQRLMTRLLESRGAIVSVAADGRTAVEQCATRSFDLVLMDVQMPEMDGLEAVSAIRKSERGRAHTPIIALTADVLPTTRAACSAAGMDGFLPKPIDLADLTREYRRVQAELSAAVA